MALSGSISTNKYTTSSHGTIGLILSWTATQSIVNNTTTISWTLKSNGTMSSGYYVQAGPVTVKIAGTTVLNTTSRFSMHGDGGYKKTGSITVAHNQDGSKSVAMSVRAAIYSASVNCTASKTFTLNKIDRYALLTSVEDFNDEGNPTITYTNPLGTELVTNLKLRMIWNNGSGYTSWVSLAPEGGSYTFNLSAQDRYNLLSGCPDSNSLAFQYDLQSTMGGIDYHDYKNATMTVVNANPTAGSVSYRDSNPTTAGITGNDQIIVQNQSTLKITTANSSPKKGASISTYILNFNGVDTDITTNKYLDIVAPNYSGTFVATVTTTDSRGNVATATKSITVVPWSAPTAQCTLARQNSFETNTDLFVDGTISSVAGSSMSITERHKETGGSWSAASPIPDNDTTVISLANTTEWEVEVAVSDAFTTTTYTLSVGKGIPIAFIDIDKSSVSIHGLPDADNQLYVGGTIKSTGKITAPSMSVQDITSQYTISKTSGNWSVEHYSAYRMGNSIYMEIAFRGNGSNVASGSNGFVGTIAGSLPVLPAKLTGYYGGTVIIASFLTSGAFNARVAGGTAQTISSGGIVILDGYFMTND